MDSPVKKKKKLKTTIPKKCIIQWESNVSDW